MSFRVRSSKFRHVFGSPYKKESCYEGIKISNNAHDNNFCAVNPLFLSAVTETAGGGSFVVLPVDKVGRVDINTPKVCGHTGPVLDIKWNPFNDHIIASASEDATVKIWQIPKDGPETNISDWMVDLHGHTRRVGYLEWHPTAENVLLSAGYDQNCILWNVETAEPVNIISVHQENIFSMAWNHDGSIFATTCKDKNLRVVDPRQGNVVSECASHQGNKATKVTFLGNKNKIFTTGSSRHCERQYAIWDMRHMTKALRMDEIDSSSGIMFLFYDPDTNVIFLAGKGDGNIRYYEVVDDTPHIHYLSQYQSGAPQRGLGMMPKRGVDTSRCEIVRFYKLHTGKSFIEPISMIVPRKSEVFQDDIYPPSASMVPSLSSDEWIAGSNRDPILMSLKDGQILATPKSHAGKAVQRKDGNIVPTITTYKAVKRGQSMSEHVTNSKRSSPLHKSVSLDHPETSEMKIPSSVRNIAKLSALEDVEETISTKQNQQNSSIDVQNRIGMFENKNVSLPSSPEKRWATNYNNSIKTEVTSPTSSHSNITKIDESQSLTTHQSSLQSSTASAHTKIAAYNSNQEATTTSKVSMVSMISVENGALPSDDSDDISPTRTTGEGSDQQVFKKKRTYNHAYRRRRENKFLNESVSDVETFTTPPTSPALKTYFEGGASTPALSSWNENPLFSEEVGASTAAVDISALDDALNEFEDLSKTFHRSTEPPPVSRNLNYNRFQSASSHQSVIGSQTSKQTSNESSIQTATNTTAVSNRSKVYKTRRDRELNREREISKSKPELSSKSMDYFSTKDDIGSIESKSTSLLHDYSSSSMPSESQADLILEDAASPSGAATSYGASYAPPSPDRASPDTKQGSPLGVVSESREMIDLMSTEAPDNTLIKPSKLRASLRSKRRPTQEVDRIISPDFKSSKLIDNASKGAVQRAGSFRDRLSQERSPEKEEGNFRRVNSMRDRFRGKEVIAIEMNNNKFEINGRLSPTQVSRPLKLALDMDTGVETDKTKKNVDTFKSATRVSLHSPSTPAKSPTVHMYSPVQQRKVQMHSPVQPYSAEISDHPLVFSSTSVEDKSTDKIIFSPDYSTPQQQNFSFKSPVLGRRPIVSPATDNDVNADNHFGLVGVTSPTQVTRKIHVKKVWSPRSPSVPKENNFVYENGDASNHNISPNTDPELRKAYFRQLEEIESYKQQINLKDKRIRQLEEELKMLRVSLPGDELAESNC